MTVLLRVLVATAGLIPWAFAVAHARPTAAVVLFHGFCHQIPDRTLSVSGLAMLVCSRCAGLYAGVALGALLPAPCFLLHRGRTLVLTAAGLLLAELLLQKAGLLPLLHSTRLASGLALGWIASAFMFATLRQEQRNRRSAPEPGDGNP